MFETIIRSICSVDCSVYHYYLISILSVYQIGVYTTASAACLQTGLYCFHLNLFMVFSE